MQIIYISMRGGTQNKRFKDWNMKVGGIFIRAGNRLVQLPDPWTVPQLTRVLHGIYCIYAVLQHVTGMMSWCYFLSLYWPVTDLSELRSHCGAFHFHALIPGRWGGGGHINVKNKPVYLKRDMELE